MKGMDKAIKAMDLEKHRRGKRIQALDVKSCRLVRGCRLGGIMRGCGGWGKGVRELGMGKGRERERGQGLRKG